jgi:hypothetical protein
MRTTRLWRYAAISLLAAGPAGGFLFGLLNAGDPDPNPIGHFFYACLMTVVTPLHLGFPPNPLAGPGQTFNVWPHIVIAGLLIFSWLVFREWKSSKRRNEPTA